MEQSTIESLIGLLSQIVKELLAIGRRIEKIEEAIQRLEAKP